jgi:putative hydrolase
MKGPFFKANALLTPNIPRVDAHMHTNWTDGKDSFKDYALRAKELNLDAIAFTEHTDDKSPWFQEYLAIQEEVRELASPVKVFFGAEVKAAHTDGTLSMSEERIIKLDFIVGVLHRYPDGNGGYHNFKNLTPEEAQQIDFELTRALLANPRVDVWGHPGGVYVHWFGPYNEKLMRELIRIAEHNNKIVEINTNLRYRSILPVIYDECVTRDCLISVGSDVHQLSELGNVCDTLADLRANYNVHTIEA